MPNRQESMLNQRRLQNLQRERNLSQTSPDVESVVNGKTVINFCSNNYLGLSNHPAVIAAAKDAIDKYGIGSGSAWVVNGYHVCHFELEDKLADLLQRQRVLIFGSGYLQNLGIISGLFSRHEHAIVDRSCHASLLDGILLAKSKLTRYRHLDVSDLEQCLHQSNIDSKYIVTDSVFSMDGDIAAIDKISALAEQYHAPLIVDDAHGFGVLGDSGRGIVDLFPNANIDILTATLSKSIGVYGAFVSGTESYIEYIMQFARSYIYTTALPPACAAAASKAIDIIIKESWRRQRIKDLVNYFRKKALQENLPITNSQTMIQPIIIGDAARASRVSRLLFEKYNIYLSAIRPPTVVKGSARLRISLTCQHQESHIDKLVEALAEIFAQDKIPSTQSQNFDIML